MVKASQHIDAELARAHAGMTHSEANFHRLVHYHASVLWNLGAGDQAVSALADLLTTTSRRAVSRAAGAAP
jgi:hypothetical protein